MLYHKVVLPARSATRHIFFKVSVSRTSRAAYLCFEVIRYNYDFACAVVQPFMSWIIWLVLGTVYYAHALNLGWAKGFYMAVNVGYSIGWGYPSENTDGSRMFSTFYVLTGASAVAASLGYFAQAMIASSKDWYAKALEQEKFRKATSYEKFIVYLRMNDSSLKVVAVWLLWLLVMIIFSLAAINWDFTEALYFAVSSLSTGGLWAIPSNSPDWYFGVGMSVSL
jgi:hypothetical protein